MENCCLTVDDVLVSCRKIFIYSKVRYRPVSLLFDVWFLFPVVGCGCNGHGRVLVRLTSLVIDDKRGRDIQEETAV